MTGALDTRGSALHTVMSPASFWSPIWVRPESAWLEHAPFGFWLVDALRPRTIVELGTSSGYSFAVFCQAVQELRLDCRCFGVDHWQGDQQTEVFGQEAFCDVDGHNNAHYKSFAQLIRSDFGEALKHFEEGSIDLLHIDGGHSYDSLRADYKSWRKLLSKSAVVLFHGTNVRESGFGSARVWQELAKEHKHFEFLHGRGLGVLGVGES